MNEWLLAVENSRKNSYFDKNTKGKKTSNNLLCFWMEEWSGQRQHQGEQENLWVFLWLRSRQQNTNKKLQEKYELMFTAQVWGPEFKSPEHTQSWRRQLLSQGSYSKIRGKERRVLRNQRAGAHYREQQDLPCSNNKVKCKHTHMHID